MLDVLSMCVVMWFLNRTDRVGLGICNKLACVLMRGKLKVQVIHALGGVFSFH
jgi:hypothetical protein